MTHRKTPRPYKGTKDLSDDDLMTVFFDRGRRKVIGWRFGIHERAVHDIQCGRLWAKRTALWRDPKVISATLISLACTGAA